MQADRKWAHRMKGITPHGIRWLRYQILYRRFQHFTMIGRRRYVLNLRLAWNCRTIRGCIVECGTWRGGMIAGMASLLGNTRSYYLFDSFEGLPDAQPIDGKEAAAWQQARPASENFNNCRAERGEAEAAMKRSPATDVHIIKGWFHESLPRYDGGPIALLRLDADWYESTMHCLENLFRKVVPGGIVMLDDYYTWPGCAQAVHAYLASNRRPEGVRQYRGSIAYIKKANTEHDAPDPCLRNSHS